MEILKTPFVSYTDYRTKPRNLNEADLFLFETSFAVNMPEVSICSLKSANILKNNIFTLLPPKFYTSYTHIFPVPSKKLLKSLLSFLKPYKKIPHGVWVTDEWSGEYFHWMTDALTRVIAAEQSGSDYVIVLPEEYRNRKFVVESLKLLNVEAYYYYKRRRLKVQHLLLPAHTALTGSYNHALINELRDRFIGRLTAKPYKRIYISRQRAAKRRIINEEEVVMVLESNGYETHFFEDYSLQKQIDIMVQTKSVVGLHGAGLTNMLFMHKGGKILELRNHKDSHNNCFFALASAMGHAYYYLANIGNTEDTYSVDVTVDTDRLREVVALMDGE
jgi:capsular polysaccharide biosynthesis protein